MGVVLTNQQTSNKQTGKKDKHGITSRALCDDVIKAASYFVQNTISFMNYIYWFLISKVIPFTIKCNVDKMYDQ